MLRQALSIGGLNDQILQHNRRMLVAGYDARRKSAGKDDIEASPHHHRTHNHLQLCIGDQTRDNRTAR